MQLETPHYVIDERRMLRAMEIMGDVQRASGVKCLLALKCFSSWCAFDFMRGFLAGTTSSSLYEARLGREKFGGETHGYSVAYGDDEIDEVVRLCDKVIFNSRSQLERFRERAKNVSVGLRLNPEVGHSSYELSNPVCRYSRLGVRASQLSTDIVKSIEGAMLHINCDNGDFSSFSRQLDRVEDTFAALLPQLQWLSLGGGVAFTNPDYPLDAFCSRLERLSAKYGLQLYLEPGEAAVMDSTSLVVQVLDIVENELPTLVVDAGVETHLLDVMTYGFTPELEGAEALPRASNALVRNEEPHIYRVCGRTCLAGDHFGDYVFEDRVEIGQRLRFPDVGGYSIVKKNFFNGIKMPAIYHKRIDGALRCVRKPTYEDYRDALS